jgi:hypothetical protein
MEFAARVKKTGEKIHKAEVKVRRSNADFPNDGFPLKGNQHFCELIKPSLVMRAHRL